VIKSLLRILDAEHGPLIFCELFCQILPFHSRWRVEKICQCWQQNWELRLVGVQDTSSGRRCLVDLRVFDAQAALDLYGVIRCRK
jgi:hypothetical protein